jgi:DnaK suppressor protein
MATKKKPVTKKTAKKAVTKKKVAKKAAAKKKPAAKKAASKKTAAKKAASKKTASKKKAAAKPSSVKKSTGKSSAGIKKAVSVSKSTLPDVPDVDPNLEVRPLYGEPYKIKKGEEYMNPEMTEHFRNILLAWKTELMEEVDRTLHHMQDEAANFPDPNDRASQETDFSLELRARDRERKLIKKIDESMDALDEREYGYCEVCGVEIGVRRLEARPTATQCIDCKTLDEIREKQMG